MINLIIIINNSEDISVGQKLDTIDTNAQSVVGAVHFNDNITLYSNFFLKKKRIFGSIIKGSLTRNFRSTGTK